MDRIASLRHRVRLERPERADDDIGGGALTWSDEGEVWASIAATSAVQGADFDAAPATTSFRIVINRREVKPGWRVVWNARSLRITGVRDDGGPQIELSCEEELL